MKVYLVIIERDGETTREPGIVSTEIKRLEYRYAAMSIEEVWTEIHSSGLIMEESDNLKAIVEERPAITVLKESA